MYSSGRIYGAVLVAIGAVGVLCSVAGTASAQSATTTQEANAADQQFVTDAINGGNQEIEQAQAQLRSADPSVRLYAQTIIRDHTAANSQIIAEAKALGLTYPDSRVQVSEPGETGTPPPATGTSMPAMSPTAYMQQEVADHQKTIGLFKGEAANGSQRMRTVAAQSLPILQSHLAMAEQYLRTGHVSPEQTPTP